MQEINNVQENRGDDEPNGFSVPLHLAGELDGPADVSAVQVKLGVEVLLGCDVRRVVRTGALRYLTLEKQAQHRRA